MSTLKLYAEYLKEREGVDLLSTDIGFAIYNIRGEECYIRDIYVQKGRRNGHEATKMADKISEIARSRGCKILTGSVDPKLPTSTVSTKVLLAYGMKIVGLLNDLLVFSKEL